MVVRKTSHVTTMTAELECDAELEIGHVLFMDIVGFSKLLVDEQSDCSDRLNQIVRRTSQFRAAEAEGKLIRLPTGDGMVLVFFTSPEAPVRCAVEIAKALKDSSGFGLRMGIHSGPVNKISDVNDRSNLAGGGINIAQRVMDCGDAGHILLSKRVAEDLEQYSKWRPHLQDFGECEVKHGVRVNVANLYTGEALAQARGDDKQQIDALTRAVASEDAMNYAEPPAFYPPVRPQLGRALLRLKRFPEAERVFRTALEKPPRLPSAVTGLRDSLKAQNRNYEAALIDQQLANIVASSRPGSPLAAGTEHKK